MTNVLKAYILYSENTKLAVPMSLMRRRSVPRIPGRIAVEVNSSLCCSGELPVIQGSASDKGLKAYILFGSNGQSLVGPVIRRNKPSGKGWRRIQYDLCCNLAITLPVITSQPDDQTVTDGDSANFQVIATGENLTYQWLLDGVEIPGATNSVYELEETDISDNGNQYSVVITNEAGSVISETALLTVNPVTTTTSTTTSTTTTVAP